MRRMDTTKDRHPYFFGMGRPAYFWLLVCAAVLAACNPFAPAEEEGDPLADLLGDPRTVDGFFTRFKAAYELRDPSLYEPLLDSAFTFTYYDADAQVERVWGYAQEVATTRRLFASASVVTLTWNQVLLREESVPPVEARVVRAFALALTFDDGQSFRATGRANFTLTRPDTTATWRLLRWRDESDL